MTNDDLSYFIGGAFYSPDKLKLIVWVGEKKPNALTRIAYNKENTMLNKICPLGDDTIYSMGAVIGYREDTGKMWQLYPLSNQLVACASTPEEVINVMGQYYFNEMKRHSQFIVNEDEGYGGKVLKGKEYDPYLQQYEKFHLKEYGYNLQDTLFWDKSLIWQKGANIEGLYNFQTKGNVTPDEGDVMRMMPRIEYPNEVVKLFNQSKDD